MVFGQWGTINKTDTQEDTADPSIASEDAIAQGTTEDDDSNRSHRNLNYMKIESSREEGRVHEKLNEGPPKWFVFLQDNIKWLFGAALVIVGVLIVITGFAARSDSRDAGNLEADRFDFSEFETTDSPTISPSGLLTPRLPVFVPLNNDPSNDPTNKPTSENTSKPSKSPSESPTLAHSTVEPTELREPTIEPTYIPTRTWKPIARPPIRPFRQVIPDNVLQFCVVADAPYTKDEAKALPKQIQSQMEGCEFLVHLGDIFIGDTPCDVEDYEVMQDIMLESHAPAFLVPGDNEWNDCMRGHINKGWQNWEDHFIGFENNWDHDFSIQRQPGYNENFYFVTKRTLIFGLNIVGGRIHNATEWKTRLRDEYFWVREVMKENLLQTNTTDGVILMAHAHPSEHHTDFFNPFRVFLRDELRNEFPVMYLHGDGHNFMYTPHYQNQPNFLRIQHEGGTIEPVLKILARPGRGPEMRSSVYDAFQYDRQLELMK